MQPTIQQPPPTHLAPQWLEAFDEAQLAQKTAMLERLVHDWINGQPPSVNHCAAIVELLRLACSSAARRTLIEGTVVQGLTLALGVPALQGAAAQRLSHFLDAYAPCIELVTEQLSMALASPGRPSSLFDGLDRLGALSRVSRARVFPELLAARISDFLDVRHSDFDSAMRSMSDIQQLRNLTEASPYAACLDAAFPAVAP